MIAFVANSRTRHWPLVDVPEFRCSYLLRDTREIIQTTLEAIGMPRRQRLDFKDAIQYVRLRGRKGRCVFFDPAILDISGRSPRQQAAGVRRFEALLASTCEECAAILLAYSIEPDAASLVLQVTGAPLAACMRRLSGQYSRSARTRNGEALFVGRYDSRVIAPEYLPHAVRRTHKSPVDAGLCQRRLDYPFSSERAYLGESTALPLEVDPLKTGLEQKGYFGSRGYRDFMDQSDSPYIAKLFEQGSPQDPRVVGGRTFVQNAHYMATHPAGTPDRDQLIDEVAQLLNLTVTDIYSKTPTGTRARALIAARALRSRAATLTEVGRWFSVTGATLGQAIQHHRKQSPEFDVMCNSLVNPS